MKVFKTAMRIIIEDETCDIIENASLLLERIKEDYATDYRKQRRTASQAHEALISNKKAESPLVLKQAQIAERLPMTMAGSGSNKATSSRLRRSQTSDKFLSTGAARRSDSDSAVNNGSLSATKAAGALEVTANAAQSTAKLDREIAEGARAICDEVIRDSIGSCNEPDYKMELAKLLSGEAKIELYIEHGKLSNAQRLACTMNRPDYVSSIIEEAARLNQNHVKTVCQLWLAKHETRNSAR